jgi:hypothetical protein
MTDTLGVLEARIRENAARYFPHLAGRDVTLRSIPLRAGSNRLYRCELQPGNGTGAPAELIAKFAPKPLLIEFDHFTLLGGHRSGVLRVPRPLDYFPDINALLTEKVEGQPLSHLVWRDLHLFAGRRRRESIAGWMRLCGQWLANYHRVTRGADAAPFDHRWLGKATDTVGELESAGFPSRVGLAARRVLARLHESGTRTLAPQAHRHGDFSLANVHVGDRWVCVFDINDKSLECVYEDLSFFLVTLETVNKWPRHPLFDRRAAVAMKAHFLKGYFESEPDCSPLLLEGHVLKQLLFRCAKQRRNLRRGPRWPRVLFDATQLRRFYPRRVLQQCERLDRLLPTT